MKKYNYIILVISIIFLLYAGISLYEKSHAQKVIHVVSMTPDEMSSALANGTIEGFISWEPYPAKAVDNGYGRYLVNSKDIWNNHPECVMAISEYLNDDDTINALVWVHLKSTRFINDPANQEKVLKYGSEFTGVNRIAVLAAINNTVYTEFLNMSEMKNGFDVLNKAGGFKKSLASMGYNDQDEFLSKIIQDKYFNEIRSKLDADPNWTPPLINGSLRIGLIHNDIHSLGIYVAQKEGYFERIGLIQDKNLFFLKFRNGMAITNAFSHREVDVAIFGATPAIRYAINDNGKIRIISGVNTGGTSLIVRRDSDIKSIDDLEGKIIATPGFGSIQDVIMRKMFDGFEIRTV